MDNRKRKAFFEKSEENRKSHQMTALEMSYLASIYNDKYKINIVMNGATNLSSRP